jgi:hypothetical protein
MKKTIYIYGGPNHGLFLRDKQIEGKTDYPLIGTTELEITPVVEEKPFPKAMKSINGIIVYFLRPGEGYVLSGNRFWKNNEYSDMFCVENFTDIKGVQEDV